MWQHFLNSLAITIPATVIPIAFAAFAAYAFAWMDFKGRDWLFIGVVALLAVPIQLSLVPLLQLFVGGAHLTVFGETFTLFPDLDLAGTTTAVWLTHIGFGLPLAIFLLHNYISSLPADLFEAARIDGADHPTIFWRLVLPLSVPALAAFAIFQFLWVWNDYLVASTFLGHRQRRGADDRAPGHPVGRPRAGLAPADRGRVRVDRPAAGRVLRPAALLRARPAGRVGEGVRRR